jgi:hypothetical protein
MMVPQQRTKVAIYQLGRLNLESITLLGTCELFREWSSSDIDIIPRTYLAEDISREECG